MRRWSWISIQKFHIVLMICFFLPIDSKHFKAIDIEYTDDSGGRARREVHGYSPVHSTDNKLKQLLIERLQKLDIEYICLSNNISYQLHLKIYSVPMLFQRVNSVSASIVATKCLCGLKLYTSNYTFK